MTAYREPPKPRCPRCPGRPELDREGTAASCPSCDGALMAEDDLLEALTTALRGRVELDEFPDGSELIVCPSCDEAMEMVWLDLIRFDRCPTHGIWIDQHELARAMRGATMQVQLWVSKVRGLMEVKGVVGRRRPPR